MSAGSTFRFKVLLTRGIDRDAFFSWAWEALASRGLVGVHEGTLLSEEAHERKLETESWTLDSGEAPRERDWVGGVPECEAELYFESRVGADGARARILSERKLECTAVEEIVPQDWDAQWKASFQGAELPPHWRILPPWVDGDRGHGRQPSGPSILRINPGAGFGTGTHETTQLCLMALGEWASLRTGGLSGWKVLDFGSGSGILSIGAALLGAEVHGVEIDPLAIDNAEENAALNGLGGKIRFSKALTSSHRDYDLVIANILKPVLLEFGPILVPRLKSGARRVLLSGLMQPDVADVKALYDGLLGVGGQASALGEWRSLRW